MNVCTIYNWKNGKNYLGDKGQEVESITNWHIGGYNSKVVPMIKEVFVSIAKSIFIFVE